LTYIDEAKNTASKIKKRRGKKIILDNYAEICANFLCNSMIAFLVKSNILKSSTNDIALKNEGV
jgi:hypothetical protein